MSDDEEEAFAGDFDDFAEEDADDAGERLPGEDDDDDDDDDGVASDAEADDDDLMVEVTEQEAKDGKVARPLQKAPPVTGLKVLKDRTLYMTSDIISNLELAKVLAVRAEQIGRNNNPFLPDGAVPCSPDPVHIALQELKAGLNPLIIQRRRTHGETAVEVVERWPVRDLIIPPDAYSIVG